MNFSKYKKFKSKNIIILLLLIIVLFIIYFVINRKEISSVELFFKGVINKVQSVIYPIKKDDIKSNAMYEIEIKTLKDEIEELKELLDINETFSNYKTINSTVIYRNVGYWYDFLTIDKGSKDGIENGMLVISSKGLIGITKNVSKYSSDVKLLTSSDNGSRITVAIDYNGNKVYGLISDFDYIKQELIVDNIISDIKHEDNMNVYTSGLTDTYPEGILIGKVVGIEKDKYGLSKIVRVRCNADFSSIRYVSVLKRES
jgi:rod shape-determining protein MreC